jgi:hypothetical protein
MHSSGFTVTLQNAFKAKIKKTAKYEHRVRKFMVYLQHRNK